MKIYARSREKHLHHFINTNLWVRVRVYAIGKGYANIISDPNERGIHCKFISDFVIRNGSKYDKRLAFYGDDQFTVSDLILLDPQDVYTDEEMKELLEI